MAFRPTWARFGQKSGLHGANLPHVGRNTTIRFCLNVPTTISCGATVHIDAPDKAELPNEERFIRRAGKRTYLFSFRAQVA